MSVEAPSVEALRAARTQTAAAPFETLLGRRRPGPRGLRADPIMRDGWTIGDATVDLTPPIRWHDDRLTRSAAFSLNAWVPLTPIVTRYDETGEPSYLRFVRAVALDWLAQHAEGSEAPFAWYDMAIGHRAHRLGWLLDASLRDPQCRDEELEALLDGGRLHARVLAQSDVMAWHSNHGLFMAVGQLALTRRLADVPEIAATAGQAEQRLARMLDTQFTPDGVHVEHSPGYHVAALRTLQGVAESGLVRASELDEQRRRVERAMAWLVDPSGRPVTIGDTTPARVSATDGAEAEYLDDAARWVVSGGRAGVAPTERVQAFTVGGYAVARTWAGDADSQLTLTAAFHSRVHKHADDGAVTWFERGGPVVIDGGRYGYRGRTEPGSELASGGYWYSDPARIYVESTHAHSTIEVGGRSWPRVGVDPYGAGVVEAVEGDGCLALRADIPHPGARHRRTSVLRPGMWLLLLDTVDLADANTEAAQRFLFAPELDLQAGPGVSLRRPEWNDALWVHSLDDAPPLPPQHGATEPRTAGWWSPAEGELEPTWTLGFARTGEATARFATLLAFGQAAPITGVVTQTADETRCSWRQDGTNHKLVVHPDRGAPRYFAARTGSSG